MGIYGQDWSSYQVAQPSTAGLDFAIVKITEGLGYVSPKWARQRDHAKASGLVWGAYHYPHMGNDPEAEADFFLQQVAWQPGDIIVLDWEGYDDANEGVSKARQLAYKESWLRYVKAKMPGHRVGMYANVDYWKNVDTTSYCGDFLWIATAGRKAGDPGIKANWMFHQFTDSPVDTDYCPLASREELRAWTLLEEDDMPLSQTDLVAVATAVWKYQVTNVATDRPVAVEDVMAWQDAMHNALVGITTRQNAATAAAINALAAQLGQQHGVDTETVVAAVTKAIADTVLNVDITVHGTPKES